MVTSETTAMHKIGVKLVYINWSYPFGYSILKSSIQ